MRARTAAAALVLSSLAASASASFVDTFFGAVKKIHPEPDQVEMTRYWLVAPVHANSVYTRVIGQDYGYIGLLAGAKAARGRKIPGTSRTFDYDTCLTPIHAFDAVFAESGEYMAKNGDDPRVKAYLEAQNEQARQRAAEEMAEYVPYWGDIPHICHFAFKTDFSVEADFREHLLRASTLKESYEAFAGGDVVTGTTKLVQVGISEEAACVLADEALAGGYVSRTPLVGDLALGLCAGFAGEVIGAIGDAAGAGYDAVNNLGDEIAGQDKHMPQQAYYDTHWKPRLAEGVEHIRGGSWGAFLAVLWEPCADYFDAHTMSRDNAQRTCDRFRDTFTAEATRLQGEQDKLAANKAAIDENMTSWGSVFIKKWQPRCADDRCKNVIADLRVKGLAMARSLRSTNAADGWPYVENALRSFHDMASTEVADSKERHEIAVNQDITDDASEAWAKVYVGSYTPRCADEECRKKVAQLAEQMVVRQKALQRERPDESSLAIQKMISIEYGQRFQKLVADSKARAELLAGGNATPDQRLVAMGCRSFLGRKGNWLCYEDAAYDACVGYARAGGATECRHPPSKRQYVASAPLDRTHPERVQPERTTPTGPIRIRPAGNDNPPPIRVLAPKEALERRGCKLFLGRADNWLCPTDAGHNACLAYKKDGRARECRRAGQR